MIGQLVDLDRQEQPVATAAKYSPQRLASHRPTASISSITAYSARAAAAMSSDECLYVNSFRIVVTTEEWSRS